MDPQAWGRWLGLVEDLKRALAKARTLQERRALLELLSPEERLRLKYTHRFWARPKQIEVLESRHTTILVRAGRGWGKGFCASGWVVEKAIEGYRHIALLAETAADARDVMVEGPSGILAVSPPWFRPVYEPSKRRLTWPNGAVATTYAAESYEALRGPNHDLAWVDELAKFRYQEEAYDQLQFTLRLAGPVGADGRRRPPLTLITTTPRPTELIRTLSEDPTVHVVTGSTYENRANLAPTFLEAIERRYAGTRLGRQELHAEILEDVEGALWTWEMLRRARLTPPDLDAGLVERAGWHEALLDALGITTVVVAVDPAVSTSATSDETGIVVVGKAGHSAIVLDDQSGTYTPGEWARKVADLHKAWRADRVVAEVNQGGDLVESNIRSARTRPVKVVKVRATRGKALRAEPVVGLYEAGRVAHLARGLSPAPGAAEVLAELEHQLTSWSPASAAKSPDRLDALVYALTDLLLGSEEVETGTYLV